MGEVLGWVPLHGSGQAIPVVSVDNTEEASNIFNIVNISDCPPLFPYAFKVELPDGVNIAGSRSLSGDFEKILRYKFYFSDGALAGGISDVYLLRRSGSVDAYNVFGANNAANQLISCIYYPVSNVTSWEGTVGDRRVVFVDNNQQSGLFLCAVNEYGYTLNNYYYGKLYKSGVSASPSDLEMYSTKEEAIENSGGSPYNPGGNSIPSGGNGLFGNDRVNDDLRPLIPSGSVENDLVDAGIFTRYLVTNAQLKEFAKVLFTDGFFSALVKELVELTFGKVYDALISVISYPFAVAELPNITLSAGDIHLGAYDTDVASTGILDKSFSQINWGNVNVNEYWGNFLDYAPHTKIQLFLPWGTGFVDIDPNECMGTYINVVTNIELSKGTCVHVVSTGNGAILGTYNGFCGSQYPITAVDTSGKAISTVIGAVSAVTSIGAGALGKGAAKSADIAASNKPTPVGLSFEERLAYQTKAGNAAAAAAAKPYQAIAKASAATAATSSLAAARLPIHFSRNGSFAANAAGMMPQKPFLIMTWPDQSVPSQYGSHVGYPSNIYENLGRLRGYTEVGAVHLDGINCTEHEREEIMSLLQGGVIL